MQPAMSSQQHTPIQVAKPDRPLVYESAVDMWLLFLVFLGPAVATVFGGYAFWKGNAGDASTLFLIAAAALAVTLAFMMPCRYTILKDSLSIRCGVIVYQIPLADIDGATLSATLLSGPALSLKRVEIRTKRKSHIVSPKDRAAFIEHLLAAAGEAKRQEDSKQSGHRTRLTARRV